MWKVTFLLGVVVSLVGGFTLISPRMILGMHTDFWFFFLAVAAFGVSGYALIGRFFAYVQPRDGYLSVVTPILRFRIGYSRIRSVRPNLIQQIFPSNQLSWAQSRFISPFYGKTVLVVETRGFPLSPALLKLFLPNVMFSPNVTGFVLLVPDWMAFSTDLDSMMGAWLQHQGRGSVT